MDVALDDVHGKPPSELQGDPGFAELARVAALCSRAKFLDGQEDVPVMRRWVNKQDW